MAFLSGLGAATFMGGGAASPLNFCQSPVARKMAATASVGCAPTPSQYCARSLPRRMSLILVATVGGVLLERVCGCSPERRVGVRRGGARDTAGTGERAATAVFD